jgi:hypothetical protein
MQADAVYQGIVPLNGADVADNVLYAVTRCYCAAVSTEGWLADLHHVHRRDVNTYSLTAVVSSSRPAHVQIGEITVWATLQCRYATQVCTG